MAKSIRLINRKKMTLKNVKLLTEKAKINTKDYQGVKLANFMVVKLIKIFC